MKPCYVRGIKIIHNTKEFKIWDNKNYLVIIKTCYVSARYNESPGTVYYFGNTVY